LKLNRTNKHNFYFYMKKISTKTNSVNLTQVVKFYISTPPSVFFLVFTLFSSLLYTEKMVAQACGTCVTANCIGIKQYPNKATAQAGVGKIWKNYIPSLTNATGSFTVYITIRTDANGQVAVMQEFQIIGPNAGMATQSQAVAASRTYKLYNLSDATCTTPVVANIVNDGCSSTFNPAWTNLQPNTDYKLALTTNLGVMAAGYTYKGFNIRFYNGVRPVSSFAFNCGSASTVGTFYVNGVVGQNGTLNVPISSATAGYASLYVSGGGFSGSAAINIAAGQTSVAIPIRFDGSGAAGNRAIAVTSTQGTGICTPNITVLPVVATFAFNCGTATSSGTFTANGSGGQTGSVTIPLSNTTAGNANFSVSSGGFSGSLTTTLTAGQPSVSIPLMYNGSGASGNHIVTIGSAQGTGSCGLNINVQAPSAGFTFNCGTASVIGDFVANNVGNQGGFITVPISSATAGAVTFTATGTGFTGTLTTNHIANQSQVSIPVIYNGTGSAGTRPLSISATSGTGTCSVNATVDAPVTNGAITFNCPATAAVVGNFVANGETNQTGLLTINFTTQTAGEVTLSVSGGGFIGSVTTQVSTGQTAVNMLVTYDGSGVAGNHAIAVTSSQATGSCATNIPVNAIFAFNCGVFNTASNFIADGTAQNGTLVIPLSNCNSGSATFNISGGGFMGSLTTILRDSQRFVAVPVVYDGSGAAGSHAVTVTSSQGSGTCAVNVKIKDPAADGCDFMKGQNISVNIHSQNIGTGYTTQYILVDESGIIRYQTATMPFVGVEVGEYEAYAVNYTGSPAPILTVGTALNVIGGNCVSVSNALPIKVCSAYLFACGHATFTGTFIANGVGGQTGNLYITIHDAKPIATTITVNSNGFTGTKTETLTAGQDTIVVPITFNGSGAGGTYLVNITSNNALGSCAVGMTVLAPPPSTPFVFNCNSAVLDGSFVANGTTQSGSVTLNIATISANATTNFTVTRTNFGGGLTNTVLSAGQTSVAIPIEYNGAKPHGTFAVTIASPNASNNCVINVPVAIDCTVQLGVLTRN
jgi:hypothetical protein